MHKSLKIFLAISLVINGFCFTGALAQVNPSPLPTANYKSIFELLRDVPGLEVRTGNAKSGGAITVRGAGSLNNQKPPLFVVDGVIFSGNITDINPQDVEGISVLKDASSTAAYGAQGAGGVIVITTKKGKGIIATAVVETHEESAYTYFIDHKTPLKVFGWDEQVIIEGVIARQKDSTLVFIKKRKEVFVPVKNILRVEMIRE